MSASPVFDSLFDSVFGARRERTQGRARNNERAARLYHAARASDDAVHDAIYSGFFDIPNARLADLFRAGDTAELGRVIAAAADKVLRESAREDAELELPE